MNTVLRWRRYTSYMTTAGVVVVGGISFLPDTLGLTYFKKAFSEYSQGQPVQPSAYMENMTEKV